MTQPFTSKNDLCSKFINSIKQDKPLLKLFKYRYFLESFRKEAVQLLEQVLNYALDKRLLGEYQEIHEIIKKPLEKVGQYKDLRNEMVDVANVIRNEVEHAESVANTEGKIEGYLKLAQFYRSYAMHKDASQNYNKLFRTQISHPTTVVKKQQYFSAWAQQLYFANEFAQLTIFIRNQIQDSKKIDCNLALVKDLKMIELNSSQFFDNVLTGPFSLTEIVENAVISQADLGLLYSLIALAKRSRQLLQIKVKWSSQLENLYLKNSFKKLFQKIAQLYTSQIRFHPLLQKIYQTYIAAIRFRVILKFLSVYTSTPIASVMQNLQMTEQQVLSFIQRQNQNHEYYFDPVTRNIVHNEGKRMKLQVQAQSFGQKIDSKLRQIHQSVLTSKKRQQGDFGDMLSGMRRGYTGSRHRQFMSRGNDSDSDEQHRHRY